MNKSIKISSNSPRQNNNPYYINDIKEEVLTTLGINYNNINNMYRIKLDNDNIKYHKYIKNFKNYIENEINKIYNIYKIGNNTDDIINKLHEHINNINEYTNFIIKLVNNI
mgnify:CR=1 FL=1